MYKVRELATIASEQLNDQEFSKEFLRWSRGKLVNYLSLGIVQVFAHRPEAFAREVTLTLAPGLLQSFPEYAYVKSLNANSDGTTPVPADFDMLKGYTAVLGPRSEIQFVGGNPYYQVVSFAINPQNPKSFYVSPVVPSGMTVTVSATVVDNPPRVTLADWDSDLVIDAKYYDCLVDFMLGWAFGVDMESAQSQANSKDHFTKAFAALGVKYKQESKYRSGFYLGNVGNGDPQAGR